jgi:hypothetical protein
MAPGKRPLLGSFLLERKAMTTRSIDEARDIDLRLSGIALARAAVRARQIAVRTGTKIVVSRNGAIHHVEPAAKALVKDVGEEGQPYQERL